MDQELEQIKSAAAAIRAASQHTAGEQKMGLPSPAALLDELISEAETTEAVYLPSIIAMLKQLKSFVG